MRSACARAVSAVLVLGLGIPTAAGAQGAESERTFVQVASTYRVIPNITYLRAGGTDLKLDVYQPRGVTDPNPTLIYFHGGGWTNGSKEGSALTFLPYLEMGWTVVNVAYRLAGGVRYRSWGYAEQRSRKEPLGVPVRDAHGAEGIPS